MARYERPFNSIEELHATELDELMSMPQQELGTAAALHYCAEHGLVPPPALVRSAPELCCALLKREKPKRRGRAAGILDRYRQDMIDYARADQVRVVREKQCEILEEVKELRRLKASPETLKERERMLAWIGNSWLQAYECVAMILKGTATFGGPDAVKASYLRFIKNTREEPLRYRILDPRFLHKLQLDCSFPNRVRKVVPLYDLTL